MEVLFASFESLSVTPIDAGSMRPKYTILDETASDYENFWSYVEIKSEVWLEYLNKEIVYRGIPLPYQKLQLLYSIVFHKGSVRAVISMLYN